MASVKQIEANRRNALKSTGPKTAAGKAASSRNATTHGCSVAIYRPIRHEDPADYHEIRAGLLETWQPQTPQEGQLIEVAASAYIRLQRTEAFETNLFTAAMEAMQKRAHLPLRRTPEDELGCAVAFTNPDNERAFRHLDRYRRTADAEYHRAIETLRRLRRDREEEPVRRYKAFQCENKYAEETTAAPKIPAEANLSLLHSSQMASFCEKNSAASETTDKGAPEPAPAAPKGTAQPAEANETAKPEDNTEPRQPRPVLLRPDKQEGAIE